MTTLELEADKARLAHAILSVEDASVLAELKKHINKVLKLNAPDTSKNVSTALTKRMLKKYAGAWSDSRSTDEIINDIHASHPGGYAIRLSIIANLP